MPDRNGDDVPDGPAEVLLDGWGHQDTHETLNSFLWGPDGSASYATLARDLALTEGALRVAVHRLRGHYRERLRAEVAHTVSDPGEVDAELRHLIGVIAGGT